ncbi:unnamed protein product [Umbelopsis ramanniana]
MVKKLSTIATVTSSTFAEKTFEVPDLKPFEVYVKIRACGVCHTDLYALGNKDVVAGHETVGEIVEMGSMVVNLKPGDIVGFGYLKGACFNCEQCTSGNEILCPARVLFPTGYGGFAHDTVFDSRFCYKIPEGIEPKYAGPLMCAGATVFTAMTNYDVKPTDRIGIVGIGGLGHLGLQFARAWGCHVVAISTNSVSCHSTLYKKKIGNAVHDFSDKFFLYLRPRRMRPNLSEHMNFGTARNFQLRRLPRSISWISSSIR